MRKVLIRFTSAILFLAIVVFSIVQLSYLYRGEYSHTRAHVAGYYAEKKDSIDVVFTGGSYMFCSFMPMEAWHDYGMASYNFSINMLFADSYKYYIREAMKTQKPKLYVIDCGVFASGLKSSLYSASEDDESISTIHTNADALNYSLNRYDLVKKIAPGRDSSFYLDLLYYHDSSWPSMKYRGNKLHSSEKGYSSLPLFSDQIYTESDVVEISPVEIPLDDELNEIFLDLIAELKKYDMEVLFVSQPNFHFNEEDETKQGHLMYMQKIVEDNGFDYLDLGDYKDEIGLNPTFDLGLGVGDHFNCFGAEKITAFFDKYIKENYDIPDHRGEASYSVWDEDYEVWMKILDGEKVYNSNFMMEVFSEECNKNKMPEILENAKEYFVIEDDRIVNKFTGEEFVR